MQKIYDFKACPLQLDDYTYLTSELDSIINTLKNKEPLSISAEGSDGTRWVICQDAWYSSG